MSTDGKTPETTLYATIIPKIAAKGRMRDSPRTTGGYLSRARPPAPQRGRKPTTFR